MNELTELERKVLDAALRGHHPVLAALREQAAGCAAAKREWTGAGFFTQLDTPPSSPKLRGSARIGGVFADVVGLKNGAGFVVQVEDGRLTLLEGYSFEESWPSTAREAKVHQRDAEPDFATLEVVA